MLCAFQMFESEKELFEKEVEKAKVKAEETASAAKNKMRKAELIIAEKQKQVNLLNEVIKTKSFVFLVFHTCVIF